MSYQSPLAMLYHWEATAPGKVYLREPVDDVWHTWTWKQTAAEVRKMAAAIIAMQLPLKSNIALISKNCAHWIMCDLAIMMSGHTSVPLYPNLNANTIKEILEHADAKLLFVGKLDDWQSMKQGVPDGIKCIAFPFCAHDIVESWEDIIKVQQPVTGHVDRAPNDISTIIYTSGTTGAPKGVMHQFKSFSFVAKNAIPYLDFVSTDKFFSYLPLSHMPEYRLTNIFFIK